jgi:hypothetical protein
MHSTVGEAGAGGSTQQPNTHKPTLNIARGQGGGCLAWQGVGLLSQCPQGLVGSNPTPRAYVHRKLSFLSNLIFFLSIVSPISL